MNGMSEERKETAPAVEERERWKCPKLILTGCGKSWIRFLDPEWSEEQLRVFIHKLWDLMDQLFEGSDQE